MTDKELLELAAKAAGIAIHWTILKDSPFYEDKGTSKYWNPLTDDGDALRLAVKLRLDIKGSLTSGNTRYATHQGKTFAEINKDHEAATRRAIVRAAAEIGKAMEAKP